MRMTSRDSTRTFDSGSPEATERVGAWLGERVPAGTLFELRGNLGAGKTVFAKGLARGLGVREVVRSPTFSICHIHEGRCRFFHLDAYRLGGPAELLLQGWDDMRAQGVVAVEWGDRIAALLPAERIAVDIEHCGSQSRRLTLRAYGARLAKILAALPAEDPPKSAGAGA